MHLKLVALLFAAVACAVICSADGGVVFDQVKKGSPQKPAPPADGANLRDWQRYLIALRAYRRYIDTLRYGRSARSQTTPMEELLDDDTENLDVKELSIDIDEDPQSAMDAVRPKNDRKIWMSILIKSLLNLL